ncbi:hypothetical protein PF011_g10143 [Phytophthora fragariae]|uniref:Uncharacterized protein n=1 Tax=Phytophthora fragariae TaxID=53985 RepID=A0A6A3L1W4_9STRA|nr:hypothetical protein PF011_g10143 [Phytophthora fragariae]
MISSSSMMNTASLSVCCYSLAVSRCLHPSPPQVARYKTGLLPPVVLWSPASF